VDIIGTSSAVALECGGERSPEPLRAWQKTGAMVAFESSDAGDPVRCFGRGSMDLNPAFSRSLFFIWPLRR